MMLVPNYVCQSSIHGLGLFAKEFIAKDTIIWQFDSRIDRCFTKEEFDALPDEAKQYCKTYGYFCPVDQTYQMEMDNGRFTNHSYEPNTYFSPCLKYWHAKKDIFPHEELTSDYREFDAGWESYAHMFPQVAMVAQATVVTKKANGNFR